MKNDGQVGQGIYSICLSGPPGAGKSFYAKTHKKVLEKLMGKEICLVKYTCNTSTGKADLYEEINITEAVVQNADKDKVILPGVVTKAIDLVNEGKNVLLFLDEYDKAREETDTFLLDFLQDGEINTTQRGRIKIKEEFLKNLQVIICKNDYREELTGPLTRRLKFIPLDYMKPDMLCRVINNSLESINQAIRDSVIMLYASIYERKELFERVPSCSECMQAIKDSETLMKIGANKSDIVSTAIIANLFKTQNDIDTFESLVQQKDNELIEWYDSIIDAVGGKDTYTIDNLKTEMARSFYPQQLKDSTKDLEEQKIKLEAEIERMGKESSEYEKKIREIEEERKKLKEREKELKQREEETQRLRKNATKDAKEIADSQLEEERKQLSEAFEEREKELKQREEETQRLRKNATKDAKEIADSQLEEERKQLSEAFEEREKRLNEKVKSQIDEANAQIEEMNIAVDTKITDYNFIKAKKQELEELLTEKEKELMEVKRQLEKFLGREIVESDFNTAQVEDEENQLKISGNKGFVMQYQENGEIQKIETENSRSVFDYSDGQNWSIIGEIVLERNEDQSKFNFTTECTKKMGKILTGKNYDNQKTVLCDDGIVLYQGTNNRTIAVRIIEKEGKIYKNLYRFYSNSMVTPIQAFKMIINLVLNTNACGTNIITKDIVEMRLKSLICSNKKHTSNDMCEFEQIEEGIYYLKYENTTEKSPSVIAKKLIGEEGLNCSTKGIQEEELRMIEEKAFIKHSEIINGEEMEKIDKIKEIKEIRMGAIEGER